MAKIFEIKDSIHVKSREKEDIPTNYEGIYSRPHETKGISFRLINSTMNPKRLVVSLVELEPNINTTTGIHSHTHNEQAYIV